MPMIVATGPDTFKLVDDGRDGANPDNYQVVIPEGNPSTWTDRDYGVVNLPGGYVPDSNWDARRYEAMQRAAAGLEPLPSPASQAAPSAQGGSRPSTGGRGSQRVVADVLRDGNRASAGKTQGGSTASPRTAGVQTYGSTSTPLVLLTGANGQASAWNEYTPEGETAPRAGEGSSAYLPFMGGPGRSPLVGGAQGEPVRATYGAEPDWTTFVPTQGGQIYPGSNGAQPIPANWGLLAGRGDPTQTPGGAYLGLVPGSNGAQPIQPWALEQRDFGAPYSQEPTGAIPTIPMFVPPYDDGTRSYLGGGLSRLQMR